ncbi:uncharacterized protein LOC127102259 [Lathyrus oleraceus]|uniref:uncharacterized protein LOC127102259 n=1 Tax=Pisum sativum TaxID=3888 RepID=UPI0021D159A8|nr:uncharacterized protein LOC127102259 [Pisum sativum]
MDPIKYIFEKPALTGRITRWHILLSKYDKEYHTHKEIKGSFLADHLAHQPIDDYQSIKFDFPDEDVMYLKAKDCDEPFPAEEPEPKSRWGLIFNVVINAYSKGTGAIVVTSQGSHIPFTTRLTINYTNNMVEYEACIMGLEEAIDLRIKILDVYADPSLLVNHIKGE